MTPTVVEAYKAWQAEQVERFENDYRPMAARVEETLGKAGAELWSLERTVEDYENLAAAAAAGTLADDYEKEARTGRKWGGWLYVAGILLLIAGASPLVHAIVTEGDRISSWSTIALRLGVGVLAASAATVAIRLGAKLINEAGSIKRMALELRTIGPFLANVEDKGTVDTTRLSLIERTFGKSYVPTAVPEKQEETINVSLITQLIDALIKLQK